MKLNNYMNQQVSDRILKLHRYNENIAEVINKCKKSGMKYADILDYCKDYFVLDCPEKYVKTYRNIEKVIEASRNNSILIECIPSNDVVSDFKYVKSLCINTEMFSENEMNKLEQIYNMGNKAQIVLLALLIEPLSNKEHYIDLIIKKQNRSVLLNLIAMLGAIRGNSLAVVKDEDFGAYKKFICFYNIAYIVGRPEYYENNSRENLFMYYSFKQTLNKYDYAAIYSMVKNKNIAEIEPNDYIVLDNYIKAPVTEIISQAKTENVRNWLIHDTLVREIKLGNIDLQELEELQDKVNRHNTTDLYNTKLNIKTIDILSRVNKISKKKTESKDKDGITDIKRPGKSDKQSIQEKEFSEKVRGILKEIMETKEVKDRILSLLYRNFLNNKNLGNYIDIHIIRALAREINDGATEQELNYVLGYYLKDISNLKIIKTYIITGYKTNNKYIRRENELYSLNKAVTNYTNQYFRHHILISYSKYLCRDLCSNSLINEISDLLKLYAITEIKSQKI